MIAEPLKLKYINIGDRGDIGHERIHLKVVSDCDISLYVLIATKEIAHGRVQAGSRPAFWFTALKVNAGDHLILYTKAGDSYEKVRTDGYTNYFFYWNRSKPLFGDPQARVLVAELNSWEAVGRAT